MSNVVASGQLTPEEADVLTRFTKRVTKKDPLWIRLLGFAAGGPW